MHPSEPCEYLEWDSKFFGKRIARIRSSVLSPELLAAIDEWETQERCDCLYFLADLASAQSLHLAEVGGFRVMDVKVTLTRRLMGQIEASKVHSPNVRFAVLEDAPALRQIAGVSHHDSRFYQDPLFPQAACHALFETWIDNSLRGWADAVFVAELAGSAVGYVTCHGRQAKEGRIGLIGVAQQARGQGLGAQLIDTALDWFREQGCLNASVVTQGRNIAAQRLYQSRGFMTAENQLWFHRWRDYPLKNEVTPSITRS